MLKIYYNEESNADYRIHLILRGDFCKAECSSNSESRKGADVIEALHPYSSYVLTEGNFKPYRQEIPSLVAYTRSWKDRTILILCNYGNETMIVPLPPKSGRTLIDNYGRTVCGKEFQLKAFEAAAVLWEKNSLEGME